MPWVSYPVSYARVWAREEERSEEVEIDAACGRASGSGVCTMLIGAFVWGYHRLSPNTGEVICCRMNSQVFDALSALKVVKSPNADLQQLLGLDDDVATEECDSWAAFGFGCPASLKTWMANSVLNGMFSLR